MDINQIEQEYQMPVLGEDKKILPFVPMDLLSSEQAYKNHGQTLQRLKQRGGLSLSEMAAILEGTDSISTRYTQLGSVVTIIKHLIAGRLKSIERIKELEEALREMLRWGNIAINEPQKNFITKLLNNE